MDNENNDVLNGMINGYSLLNLNNMVYSFNKEDDNLTDEVDCRYLVTENIKTLDKCAFSVIGHNIGSMKTNFLNFQGEIMCDYDFDIMGFCETKLTDDTAKLYTLPNYNFFSNNVSSNMGGVCLYVKQQYHCTVRGDLSIRKEHLESIFVECRSGNKCLTIGMVYRRPGTSYAAFQADLETILSNISSQCILIGDFNLNLLNESSDNIIANFVNSMREFSYQPTIVKPTRVQRNSATVIDHIWVNFTNNFNHNSYIIASGISDHFPIIYCYHPFRQVKMSKGNTVITFRENKEQNDNHFKERIEAYDFSVIYELNDVNLAFSKFNEILLDEFNRSYPKITKVIKDKKRNNPWLTLGLKESIKTKNRLYKKFVKYPIQYGEQYRAYRNRLSKLLKVSKN